MSNLTNQVLDRLDPSSIQAIAAQLGIDPSQAQAAIQQAVPLVVGGLARNAATDGGADAVHTAATAHSGLDIGSILGSVLGGAGNAGGGSILGGMLGGGASNTGGGLPGGIDPGAILGSIFGNRQDQATQGLGQASGLGTQNAGQLLAILAPIVMSVLGSMSQRQGLNPGGLGGALAQENQRIQQSGNGGLLGAVLDQDGDGQLGLGDLLKVGAEMLGGARGRA
ncbi:DUF937 domain-containing protein [Dokdonella sp.]|uniref:DUF937 domain-containing protein n=1 Tax=Dokdonella sp. TaxID=2291710 RepID=UPI001B15F7DA|nr:DUF937 domain-containing protein [Dokdonella sp.]MBO9661428.1 DUF937 domain-containing protein [Dokdonella sp.]